DEFSNTLPLARMVRTSENPASVKAVLTSAILRLTPPTLTPRRNAAYVVMLRFHQGWRKRRNGDVGFRHGTPSLRRQAAGRDQWKLPRGAGHHQARWSSPAVQRAVSLRPARGGGAS